MTPVFLTVTLQYMVPQKGAAAEAEALRMYHDDIAPFADLGVSAEVESK
jgi:hypothetical protein